MAYAQSLGVRGGLRPLRPRGVRRSVAASVRAVAEPVAKPGNSNGSAPTLAGWSPESWRQRVALQVGRERPSGWIFQAVRSLVLAASGA
jgi:hypothetical protein